MKRKEANEEAGRYIRHLRRRSQLTQKALADRLGVDYYSFVGQIERGSAPMPSTMWEAAARAFEVSPQTFARNMLALYDPHAYKLIYQEPPPRRINTDSLFE